MADSMNIRTRDTLSSSQWWERGDVDRWMDGERGVKVLGWGVTVSNYPYVEMGVGWGGQ